MNSPYRSPSVWLLIIIPMLLLMYAAVDVCVVEKKVTVSRVQL